AQVTHKSVLRKLSSSRRSDLVRNRYEEHCSQQAVYIRFQPLSKHQTGIRRELTVAGFDASKFKRGERTVGRTYGAQLGLSEPVSGAVNVIVDLGNQNFDSIPLSRQYLAIPRRFAFFANVEHERSVEQHVQRPAFAAAFVTSLVVHRFPSTVCTLARDLSE